MKLALSNKDLAFQTEVREFITQYWPERVRRRSAVPRPEEQAWIESLVSKGWSVQGWTPTQRFIWERETALAETPPVEGFRTSLLQSLDNENHKINAIESLLNPALAPAPGVANIKLQLQRVAKIAAATASEGRTMADDETFQRKHRELEVELLGLEMLELRMLADLEAGQSARREARVLGTVVELKSAQIGQRIAELVVETLGYYALPCPDELLIDNEGSIGPDHALGASQRWLFSCAGSTRGASADTQKDAIARIALELIGDRVAS